MISERLKQLRENKGYNMRQMAAALNLPYTTYVNYEKGEREPNSEQLILFSKYFDVSIDYIIGITNNIKNCEPCNDIMTKGERIKLEREKAGLTQVEFAERIGVAKQNLYKYENDIITNIPSDKIENMANVLGVSPAYIMGWNENQNNDIDVCKYLSQCHNTEIYTAVEMLIKLDTFDLGRIIGNIEEMLKAEKYTEKEPQVTTIYRAARSVDNHPAEIVETTKDFSKIPPTDIKF